MDTLRAIFRKPQDVPTTSFQILSDLHLEVGQQYDTYTVTPSAPYLILAGDIGRLIDYDSYLIFLRRCIQDFKLVFLLLGNHEFYGGTYEEGMEAAERLERDETLQGRLVLMDKRKYELTDSNVTILGCTLWSHIPDEDDKPLWCRMKVSDFSKIEKWTPETHNAAHKADLDWLKAEVAAIQAKNVTIKDRSAKRRILVVTHHAPLMKGTSKPEFQDIKSQWSCAFATDVLKSGDWSDVKTWVFGHTHYSTEFLLKKSGTRVVSNQRGYVIPRSEMFGVGAEKKRDDVKYAFDETKVVAV